MNSTSNDPPLLSVWQVPGIQIGSLPSDRRPKRDWGLLLLLTVRGFNVLCTCSGTSSVTNKIKGQFCYFSWWRMRSVINVIRRNALTLEAKWTNWYGQGLGWLNENNIRLQITVQGRVQYVGTAMKNENTTRENFLCDEIFFSVCGWSDFVRFLNKISPKRRTSLI